MRCGIIFCALIILCSSAQTQTPIKLSSYFLVGLLPSGISKKSYEYGGGLSFDYFLIQHNYIIAGPGLRLSATIPGYTGNKFVKVAPYSFAVEPRFSLWLNFNKNYLAIMPFVSLRGRVGLEVIVTKVNKSTSNSLVKIFGLGPEIGVAYWFDKWGLESSYYLSLGTQRIRHEFDFAFVWRSQ